MPGMEYLIAALLVAVIVLLLVRRTGEGAFLQSYESVARSVGSLQAELARMAHQQDELRQDVQRSRESSLLKLAETAQGIRGEIGATQKALAEVKALEQGRARMMEQAAESLRRLEAVVAGSGTRGSAGENILARSLSQLPPDLLEINVAFGNKVVEYALRLPGGRFLPIDSKWTSVGPLERLAETTDVGERRRLTDQVARELRARIREMSKYLEPDRTLGLAVLAVPDAVHAAAPEVHAEGYREGVLIVPYTLALPFVLALYRLTIRFGTAIDADQLTAHLRRLDDGLRRIEEEVEGRFSRGLVQVENARDALRGHVADAQRSTSRLLRSTETEETPALAGRAEPLRDDEDG
jgi:DNA recombination protein RmuC